MMIETTIPIRDDENEVFGTSSIRKDPEYYATLIRYAHRHPWYLRPLHTASLSHLVRQGYRKASLLTTSLNLKPCLTPSLPYSPVSSTKNPC